MSACEVEETLEEASFSSHTKICFHKMQTSGSFLFSHLQCGYVGWRCHNLCVTMKIKSDAKDGKSKAPMVSGRCHMRSKLMLLILRCIRNLLLLIYAISEDLCSPISSRLFYVCGFTKGEVLALERIQPIKCLLGIHEALNFNSPGPM